MIYVKVHCHFFIELQRIIIPNPFMGNGKLIIWKFLYYLAFIRSIFACNPINEIAIHTLHPIISYFKEVFYFFVSWHIYALIV